MMNANLLKRKIKESGKTQADIATIIGISRGIFNYKINNDKLYVSEASMISSVLNLSYQEMVQIFFNEMADYIKLEELKRTINFSRICTTETALELQVPKKPLEQNVDDLMKTGTCQNCKCESDLAFDTVVEIMNYCPSCGQRLDWN